MSKEGSAISCGVLQLFHLNAEPSFLCEDVFLESTYDVQLTANGFRDFAVAEAPAFAIFSDIKGSKAAAKFIKFIKTNKLGTVSKSPAAYNPNTGNDIVVYTWKINHRNLYKAFN